MLCQVGLYGLKGCGLVVGRCQISVFSGYSAFRPLCSHFSAFLWQETGVKVCLGLRRTAWNRGIPAYAEVFLETMNLTGSRKKAVQKYNQSEILKKRLQSAGSYGSGCICQCHREWTPVPAFLPTQALHSF